MERINLYGNKFLDFTPGFIFGIIAIIIGITGDLLAMSLSPGYSITKDMVSTLGVGQGAIYFNLGTFYSGLIAIPFYLDLGRFLSEKKDNIKLIRPAIIFAVISCVSLALVGIFPAIQNDALVILFHYFSALISWFTGMIYCVLFSLIMLRNSSFPKLLAYYGFIPGSLIIFYLIIIIIPLFNTIVPIIEWSIVFAIISFIALHSSYMIYEKIKRFNNERKK